MTVVPTSMPVMSPAHFFRFEAVHLIAGDHSGTGLLIRRRQSAFRERMRRKRRGVRARGKRCGARNKSKAEFQKMAAFHDVSLLVHSE